MPEVIRTSRDATDAPLNHTVRETPRAQSPFGPMRKREKPPVKVPGQRGPSDTTPRPAPPISVRPLGAQYNRGAYDEAFTALQYGGYDRYGAPAAWAAFGDDAESPKIPGPRQPSEYGSAA